MKRILVANAKGGSGKTTLATNLAGLFAARRARTVLADMDHQQSAARWLARRPAGFPQIEGWTRDSDLEALKAFDPQWVIYDSPAGLGAGKLEELMKRVDLVLVPIAPSVLDMDASVDFLELLAAQKGVRKGVSRIALIANRVDPQTIAARELDDFFAAWDLPVLTHLHAAQVYVRCAALGLSLFDLPRSRAMPEIERWDPLRTWLARHV